MKHLAGVEVRLLGRPCMATGGDWLEPPPGKVTALALYLAFHGGWVGRGDLVFLFWPDAPEARARGNLRPLLWRLAREAYARGLERERQRVCWRVRTDVQCFRDALASRDWLVAWQLGRAELLKGFVVVEAPEFDTWLAAERAEIARLARAEGLRAVEVLAAREDHGDAAGVAADLHRDDPLDETVLRSFLLALARSGSKREALAVFDRFRRVLDDELETLPEEATLDVVAAIRSGVLATAERSPETGAAARQARPLHSTMPLQPTRFVGRVLERAHVAERLTEDGCRLVTIVGPGGTGKTRLAIEVASDAATLFRDGAWFVDLAGVGSVGGMVAAIASAIGVVLPQHGRAIDHLLQRVSAKVALLVLDNVEHLVAERGFVADLLTSAPGVTILATSRVRLGVRGERLYDLAGLTYLVRPAAGAPADAVTLFVRCVRRIRPDLTLGPEETRCIERICALVEGLPLALELSAAWSRALTLAEIEGELKSNLGLLDAAGDGRPDRHGDMGVVFAHSWALLRPRERVALRRLAVFRGGWTREAAAAVAGVGMSVLLALIDASLVRRLPSGRFAWHPLVGQFAAARAGDDPDEREDVAQRHAQYFLGFVVEREQARRHHDGGARLAEVDGDLDNVRAAWAWAVAQSREDLLADASNGLWMALFATNRLRLLRSMLRAALATATPGERLRGRAAVWLGSTLCQGSGEIQIGRTYVSSEGLALLQEGAAIAEARGDVPDLARALQELGVAYGLAGRVSDSAWILRRGREAYRSLGDVNGVASMVSLLAEFEPDFGAAVEGFRAAVTLASEAGLPMPVMMASEGVGTRLFLGFGAYGEAAAALLQCVELCEHMGFSHWAATGRLKLAYVLISGGALGEAQALLEESFLRGDERASDDASSDLAKARSLCGWAAFLEGDRERAERWSRAALEVTATAWRPETEARARTVLAAMAIERDDLETAVSHLARARSVLSEAKRISFGHGTVPAGDVLFWTRLHACEVELMLKQGRRDEAAAVVDETLTVAVESGQQPAATIVLAIAARLLEASGDVGSVEALATFVLGTPATPIDAALAVRRLQPAAPAPGTAACGASGASVTPRIETLAKALGLTASHRVERLIEWLGAS